METRDRAKGGQGKGKDKDAGPASTDAKADAALERQNRSVLSRVADSAADLGSSWWTSRPMAQDLASVASPEKDESPRRSQASRNGESSSAYRPVRPQAVASFRGGHVSEHIAQQENAFSRFLDGTDVVVPMEPPSAGTENAQTSLVAPTRLGKRLVDSGPPSAAAQQARRDGAEVVDLLSQTEDAPDFGEDLTLDEGDLANLRQALFPGSPDVSSSTREWDTVLNFIPEFVRPDGSGEFPPGGGWKAEESHQSLGLDHSPEAARVWVEQWQDVLTRYTEEVWGDLTPLVRQAQKELEQARGAEPRGPRPNLKAVHRLRQILGHLRHS